MNPLLLDEWQPRVLSVLRIIAAFLLIPHGSAKILGVPHQQVFDGLQLMSLLGIAGILELAGGILLLIGLFTRPVAFVLCGFMAAAYFIGHAVRGMPLVPMLNGGELAVLYCFVFLYLAFAGGGEWSVDEAWRNREEEVKNILDINSDAK